MTQPGPIALRAADDAEANVGVTEVGGNNRGRYVDTYLRAVNAHPGDPWCAAFVAYRLRKAAASLRLDVPDGFPLSAWTPDYKAWAVRERLWIPPGSSAAPRRGDLACYWFEAKGRIAHIGIVVGNAGDGWFEAVEGNTSPDSGGVSRDGDGVYRKHRRLGAVGVNGGWVRLPW